MPVTDKIEGHTFFTRIDAKRAATPLFAALVVVEVTDVIFAVDSVPAILAVSREPFLVFASNAFAILGLRAMYFLLAGAKERFHYLSHALGGILVFVGIKMSLSHWIHLNTYVSLVIILGMLAAAIVFSVRRNRFTLAAAITHMPDVPDRRAGRAGPGNLNGWARRSRVPAPVAIASSARSRCDVRRGGRRPRRPG